MTTGLADFYVERQYLEEIYKELGILLENTEEDRKDAKFKEKIHSLFRKYHSKDIPSSL